MKSFLNYSKNKILYNLFRILFVFLLVFLVNKCEVKAEIKTGEIYPEFATHKVPLLKIMNIYTNVTLYGYDPSDISDLIDNPPTLESFLNGSTSLVRYEDNTYNGYSNWAFTVYEQNLTPGTYLLSWQVDFTSTSYAEQFCKLADSPYQVLNGTINSYTCSSALTKAYIAINFDLNSNMTEPYVDFNNTGTGLSINWFLRNVSDVYYPQIIPSVYFDTEGLEEQNNIIINQNQTIIDQNNETNNKLDNIQGAITDETPPNTDSLSNSAGWLPAGPVDSILNLPLTMFQNISNNLGSTCTPIYLPLPYVNKSLELPCFNSIVNNIEGLAVWWNGIGVVASAFILYSYLMKLYKWVDDTLTMRENTWQDWGGV